ncbi:MAG: cysteine desulfurase [Planctomycetota bacterium]|nr:MAG: cysteine desulfurase [Planctomycetota bacterium]
MNAPPPLASLRQRFPALADGSLAPLDNAATTHRPQAVLDALARFYVESNANVHRANHRLGAAATAAYEGARRRVARFLGAQAEEVVFTRNATEGINLVARGFLEARLQAGQSVCVSRLEHHSNLVPWQELCKRTGARLHWLEIDDHARLAPPFEFPDDAAFVACTRVSNAVGTIVDTTALVRAAHARELPVLLDITQAAGHLPLDEGTREADFLALSAHKMYGPMGLGVLVGRGERLAQIEPQLFGGEMVESVSAEGARFRDPPWRLEAGTPAVAPAAAFVPALDLLDEFGVEAIRAHELELLQRLLDGLAAIDSVSVVGPASAAERSGAVSLALGGADAHTVGTILDMAGVAVRAGFHCAEPLLRQIGCGPTLRASVAAYSNTHDVDRFLAALPEAVEAARFS